MADNGAQGIPLASIFNPTMVDQAILPTMFVLDVIEDGTDFRWRLFGTSHAIQYGTDATGMRVSDAARRDSAAKDSLSMGQLCYAERRPVFYLTNYTKAAVIKKSTGTVLLPMADNDSIINRILGCSTWQSKGYR